MSNVPYDQQFPIYVEGTTQCALFDKKVIIDQIEATLKLRKPTNKEFMMQLNSRRIHDLLFTMQFLGTDVIHCQALAQCARTIFELGLDIAYADFEEKNGNADIYDKFVAYATVVDKYRRADKYIRNNPNANNDYIFIESSKFINDPKNKTEYDRLSKQYFFKNNKVKITDKWSGHKISERAEKVKGSYLDIYKSDYAFLSDFTHSSGTIFTNTQPEILTVNPVISVYSHILVQKIFPEITKIVAKIFYIDKTFPDFDLRLAQVLAPTDLKLKELKK